jgi:hypothetical protein
MEKRAAITGALQRLAELLSQKPGRSQDQPPITHPVDCSNRQPGLPDQREPVPRLLC